MKWLDDFASLIYPRVCCGCGETLFRHEDAICNRCHVALPRTNFHLQDQNPVARIFYGRANVKFASSFLLFSKKGIVQNMLHALKYRSKQETGVLLGKWYASEITQHSVYSTCDVIVPVPLHHNRLRKRGYNQSECIARGMAEKLNLPVYPDVLRKTVATETQTFKSREERAENTMNSFGLAETEKLRGKHILLVDDVITTGATTEACIHQLNRIPGVRISVASIGYTE